jgi:Mrp family chromosome partitioning ATPase
MERIKQAIEKATQQNLNEGGRMPYSQSDDKTGPSAGTTPQSSDVLEKVSYQQTRVVKLKADILEKNRIFAFNKDDPASMIFDLLRTQVLQTMEEKGWRTLAITSATPGAGKTAVAINLAMSIAQKTNRSAMLVDFDLRQPRIGTYLGLPMEKSLNDLLNGDAELSEILVNPDIPRLVIVPTREAVSKPSEVLSSNKIAGLIKDLRERYDSRITIFDLPSLLHSDDAISVIPQIDCILMVVANGMSSKLEIENALRHLSRANLIGTVFNKA